MEHTLHGETEYHTSVMRATTLIAGELCTLVALTKDGGHGAGTAISTAPRGTWATPCLAGPKIATASILLPSALSITVF